MCMAVKTHSKQDAGREAGATAPEVKSAPRISILQVILEGFLKSFNDPLTYDGIKPSWQLCAWEAGDTVLQVSEGPPPL